MPHSNPPPLRLVSNRDDPVRRAAEVRAWSRRALTQLQDLRSLASETPIIEIPCPELPGVQLILKDESLQPSGSLKHRLAYALFELGLVSGDVGPDTVIVEASSGSTAISLAWFAQKLGLPFVAVVPDTTALAKLDAIADLDGEVILVPAGRDLRAAGADIAARRHGHFMDQYGRAAEASDWRGGDNIAASLRGQLYEKGIESPAWIVAGVGTGGTAATIGRYIRSHAAYGATRLCVVDPERSAYFQAYSTGDMMARGYPNPAIEGIGRSRVAPAFVPGVIDHMISIADEGAVSGAHWLAARTGLRFGPSTGANVIGALIIGKAMARRAQTGVIALIGGDAGERYAETIYDPAWCAENQLAPGGWHTLLAHLATDHFPQAF